MLNFPIDSQAPGVHCSGVASVFWVAAHKALSHVSVPIILCESHWKFLDFLNSLWAHRDTTPQLHISVRHPRKPDSSAPTVRTRVPSPGEPAASSLFCEQNSTLSHWNQIPNHCSLFSPDRKAGRKQCGEMKHKCCQLTWVITPNTGEKKLLCTCVCMYILFFIFLPNRKERKCVWGNF